MTPRKLKITHVITGLPRGGAQSVLCQLLEGANPDRFDMDVISLTDRGPMGEKMAQSGISVRALNMARLLPNPGHVVRLARWLRRDQPDLVQTWLYHGDLVGGLAARLARRPVLWNLRQSDLDPETTRRSTLWTAKACARLSRRIPRTIVCCSEASKRVHRSLGYDQGRMVVIGNGVDLAQYRPDENAAGEVRRELGLGGRTRLIGLVARFHPQKDHRTFVRAAGDLCKALDDVHFVICGEDVDGANPVLAGMIRETGVGGRFHLLGVRDDVARITAAFDIATSSSSYGEGFANVLLEAMACGVPCVTTDVGDSALIAGDSGWVVPAGDAAALTNAWRQAMELAATDLRARGSAARARAEQAFSISSMIERYETLYADTVMAPFSKSP